MPDDGVSTYALGVVCHPARLDDAGDGQGRGWGRQVSGSGESRHQAEQSIPARVSHRPMPYTILRVIVADVGSCQ